MKKLPFLVLFVSGTLAMSRAQVQAQSSQKSKRVSTQTAPKPLPEQPAAPAGPLKLSTVRTAEPGTVVTVRGVVTNGPELGNIRYIQDKEAGLALFSNTSEDLKALVPGDSVEAQGTLKN